MSCNLFSVWPLADGRRDRDSGHITKPEPLPDDLYGGMPKPGSTYGRSGNLAETTLAETDNWPKVILEAVLAPYTKT